CARSPYYSNGVGFAYW
nr:immunoglobulin heavy chain junction region [Mus musculus]MBK4198362.1 immunoglobulin heavy chain junction region [Mus musculus]MBK4198363.1 immunoglobulin heavy chain junction region [Mus musculus]MBK4198365.1 immunoglobulin heavy chain junction region [Mus musculus]